MRYAIGLLGCALMLIAGMALPFLPPLANGPWWIAGGTITGGFLMFAWGVLSEPPQEDIRD